MSFDKLLAAPLRFLRGLTGKSDCPTRSKSALVLCQDLRHPRASRRVRAARIICEGGIYGAADELVRAAADTRPLVRRAALGALLAVEPDRFADAVMSLSCIVTKSDLQSDLDAVVEDSIRLESRRVDLLENRGGDNGAG